MSTITISDLEGVGQAPIYTGITATGTATAEDAVAVYYEIASNGVRSANLNTTANSNGIWSVTFDGEFNANTCVTVVAGLTDGAQASKDITLPTD